MRLPDSLYTAPSGWNDCTVKNTILIHLQKCHFDPVSKNLSVYQKLHRNGIKVILWIKIIFFAHWHDLAHNNYWWIWFLVQKNTQMTSSDYLLHIIFWKEIIPPSIDLKGLFLGVSKFFNWYPNILIRVCRFRIFFQNHYSVIRSRARILPLIGGEFHSQKREIGSKWGSIKYLFHIFLR